MPSQGYVWGLSSLMVTIVLSLQIIWILGTYLVWLDAERSSKLRRVGRRMHGPFRAAQDLSEAITEVLGHRTCAYTDDHLKNALKDQLGLRYYAEDAEDDEVSHVGLTTKPDRALKLNRDRLYGRKRKTQ